MKQSTQSGWSKTTGKNLNPNLTNTGFRISKNGAVIKSIEEFAITSKTYEGSLIRQHGGYYFLNRRQGGIFIYLED